MCFLKHMYGKALRAIQESNSKNKVRISAYLGNCPGVKKISLYTVEGILQPLPETVFLLGP